MRRLYGISLAVAAAAVLAACSILGPPDDPASVSRVEPASSAPASTAGPAEIRLTEPFAEFQSPWPAASGGEGREALSEPERSLYDELRGCALAVSPEADPGRGQYPMRRAAVEDSLSETEISRVFEAFVNDFPQYFWISAQYQYGTAEGLTVVQLYSELSPEDCAALTERLEQAAQDIFSGMEESMTELEREIFLHDAVLDSCVYDASGASGWEEYSVCGVLLDGSAVCEGYARTMQLLLRLAGIPCRLVSGEADGELHMWNLVQIGGNWYHLDSTWDDSSDLSRYFYFNLTDRQIQEDHSVSTQGLPDCGSEDANYFRNFAIPVSGLSGFSLDTLSEGIAQSLRRGEEILLLYVEKPLNFQDTAAELFSAGSPILSDALREAVPQVDPGLQYTSFVYSLAPSIRGIAVQLQ